MSAELKNSLQQDWNLEDLGIFALKGKKVKVQAFSLANPLVDELMTHEQFIDGLAVITK